MKKLILMAVFALIISLSISAQESLAGRIYHCANMMKKEMEQAKKELNAEIQKEKGVTAEDRKEINEVAQGMIDAIVTTMTVKFISDKELELSMVAKYDDDKAKANGIPWVLRKMVGSSLKGKLKDTSFTGKKTPYTFDGKTVKAINPKTNKGIDFQLTADGKTLIFVTEEKTVRLSRTK